MPEHPISRAVHRVAAPHGTGTEPDLALLDRWVRARDQSAFELLVWRYGAMVLATCRRVLPPADAEDAFQATFLVLVQKAGSVGRLGTLGGWLHRVAVRTCRAARRKAASRPLPLEAEPEAPVEASTHELRAVLDEELDHLPERFRQVLVLCYLQEKTAEEAAEELGCPRGTVLSRLLRGRERLRTRLARRGFVLPAVLGGLVISNTASATWPVPRLVNSTVEGASGKVGSGVVGTAPTVPAELAREVLNAMWMTTVKKLLVAALVVTALGLGVGLNWPATAATGAGTDPNGDLPPVNTVRPLAPPGTKAEKPDPKKELEKLKGDTESRE